MYFGSLYPGAHAIMVAELTDGAGVESHRRIVPMASLALAIGDNTVDLDGSSRSIACAGEPTNDVDVMDGVTDHWIG